MSAPHPAPLLPLLALVFLVAEASPATAWAASYVTTDQQTLDALSVAGSTPPVNYATYLSGGSESVGYSNSCDFGYFMEPGSSADSLAAADLNWTQSGAGGLLFSLPYPTVTVVVFPSIDHGPFPNEGIEYTVWGSDTGDLTNFPTGWDMATLATIYREGWQDACPGNGPGEESDDFAGLYGFHDSLKNYILVLPSGSITIYEDPTYATWIAEGDDGSDPGWQSADFEIDAVGIPDCAGGVVAVAGDVGGLVGELLTLDGSGSLGTIATFGWDLNQDFAVDLSGSVVEYAFAAPGSYLVGLSVVGEDGCSDFDEITVTVCDPALADADADGYLSVDCGGNDCDDQDGSVHPGAGETDGDGIDQDCDGRDDVIAKEDDDVTPPPGDDDSASGGPAPPEPGDYTGSCACTVSSQESGLLILGMTGALLGAALIRRRG